jgi:hypothetical protein
VKLSISVSYPVTDFLLITTTSNNNNNNNNNNVLVKLTMYTGMNTYHN